MFCKTVSPVPVFVRIPVSHHPGTRLRLVPGFRDLGSVLILGQVTQYGNPYLICIFTEIGTIGYPKKDISHWDAAIHYGVQLAQHCDQTLHCNAISRKSPLCVLLP